jgi:DnaJ domain
VNHYERLKVSPDAPPEVIRAAYRALAAKFHPDRQQGDSGPGDPLHEDMAALNASYMALMDSKARAEYDRSLAAEHAAAKPAATGGARWGRAAKPEAAAPAEPPDTRIDVGWMTSAPPLPEPWFKEPKWILATAMSMGIALAGLAYFGMQQAERSQFDRSLSDAGVQRPPQLPPDLPPEVRAVMEMPDNAPPAKGASAPVLTPEQMAKMTDAELLAAMPELIGSNGKPTRAASAPHGKAPSAPTEPMDAMPEAASGRAQPPVVALVPQVNHMLDGQPLSLKLAPMKAPPQRP